MIQWPLTGATESDAASSADVAALTATVSTHSTKIATKDLNTTLTAATVSITSHTGEIGPVQTSFNGLRESFYTKPLADALLNGKQPTITDGSLSIARTTGLQRAINGIQPTIAEATFTSTLTTFTTPVTCKFDFGCADLT